MKFDYCKGDYTSMNKILSGKDWHTLLSSSNIDENWATFKNLLSNLADRFIPKLKLNSHEPVYLGGLKLCLKLLIKNIVFIISTVYTFHVSS